MTGVGDEVDAVGGVEAVEAWLSHWFELGDNATASVWLAFHAETGDETVMLQHSDPADDLPVAMTIRQATALARILMKHQPEHGLPLFKGLCRVLDIAHQLRDQRAKPN
jgi:hypothetical protein